jgi:hypothetical protein
MDITQPIDTMSVPIRADKAEHVRGSGIWSYTLRSAGAILFVSVPATIMTSDWRGLARKTTPRRSWSYLDAAMCIISTAQQARPEDVVRHDGLQCHTTTLLAKSHWPD